VAGNSAALIIEGRADIDGGSYGGKMQNGNWMPMTAITTNLA
jgi:hypothetical protein